MLGCWKKIKFIYFNFKD